MAIEIARDLKTINAELKNINSSFRSAQKEASSLQRALKLDPSNMKLVGARTKELETQLELCTKKIDLLKEAENRLVAQNGVEAKLSPQFQKLENFLRGISTRLSRDLFYIFFCNLKIYSHMLYIIYLYFIRI